MPWLCLPAWRNSRSGRSGRWSSCALPCRLKELASPRRSCTRRLRATPNEGSKGNNVVSKPPFYPVILAGGSGTRFWPRSRRKLAKQVLALDGKQTMIQKTMERLLPLGSEKDFWVITNEFVAEEIQRQLPRIPERQIVVEPEPRNTAPAIGLAAFLLERIAPESIIGMFPADHAIGDEKKFRKTLQRAIEIAAKEDHIVVMGVQPARAETGYGYIETGDRLEPELSPGHAFTGKPNQQRAEKVVA